MSDEIPVGDQIYVSSRRASEISGYAQDYIGQLARSHQIEAKRVGGLWYVHMDSLESYKTQPDVMQPISNETRTTQEEPDVLVSFDGRDYISANRASKITGYNQDYIGQLARSGKILARQVGNRWYIDHEGILAHKKEKDSLLAAVQAESVGIHPTEPVIPNSPPVQYFPPPSTACFGVVFGATFATDIIVVTWGFCLSIALYLATSSVNTLFFAL